MDVAFNHTAQQWFESEVEVKQFAKVLAGQQDFEEVAAGVSDAADEIGQGRPGIVTVLPQKIQLLLKALVELVPRRVKGGFEIRSRMAGLKDGEEVLKIVNQPVFQVGNKLRLAADWPFKAFEPFAGGAAGLEGLIKALESSIAAEKLQESPANDDVVRSGVIMQFLVPFFQEMPADLLDVVAVHDIEDFIANPLAFAAAADRRQRQADQRPQRCLVPVDVCKFGGESILCIGQIARLGVVVALPCQLADGGETEPNVEQRERCRIILGPVQEVVTEIEPVHQRPGIVGSLRLDNFIPQPS